MLLLCLRNGQRVRTELHGLCSRWAGWAHHCSAGASAPLEPQLRMKYGVCSNGEGGSPLPLISLGRWFHKVPEHRTNLWTNGEMEIEGRMWCSGKEEDRTEGQGAQRWQHPMEHSSRLSRFTALMLAFPLDRLPGLQMVTESQ